MKRFYSRFSLLILMTALLLSCSKQESTETAAEIKVVDRVLIDGEQVYQQHCIACHAEGPGHPGSMRLGIRLGEDKAVLTKRTDLQAEYVKIIVRQGILLMPPFRPSEINAAELEALSDFLSQKTRT